MIKDILFNRQPKPGYFYHYKPFPLYRNREMEDYLNYMATTGRLLSEIKRGIRQKFIFKIIDPKELHYKLVLSKKKNLEEEVVQDLERHGWDYVCSENPLFRKQSFHIFSSIKESSSSQVIDTINKEAVNRFRFRSILSSGIVGAATILLIYYYGLSLLNEPRVYKMFYTSRNQIIIAEILRYGYLLKPEWEFYIGNKKEGKRKETRDWRKLSSGYKRTMGVLSLPLFSLIFIINKILVGF